MSTAIYRFGASMVSDDRRYVVTMRADALIKTLVPTDGSVAPAPRKELSQ
jgi:hypothetical protein